MLVWQHLKGGIKVLHLSRTKTLDVGSKGRTKPSVKLNSEGESFCADILEGMVKAWLQDGEDAVGRDAARSKPELHGSFSESEDTKGGNLGDFVGCCYSAKLGNDCFDVAILN